MKKINFNVRERVGVINLLNELYQKGGLPLQGLVTAGDISKKLGLDDKTKKKIDWKVDKETGAANWKPKKDKGLKVELTSDEEKLLKDIIETKDKEKKFGIGDMYLVELAKKLDLIE